MAQTGRKKAPASRTSKARTPRASAASKARAKSKPAAPSKAGAAKGGGGGDGSRRVEERIRSFGGWRGAMLAHLRGLIRKADPSIEEDCKWFKPSNPLGVPVWSHGGIVCTGEAYKEVVKLTFMRGASLDDPKKLFNASLEAGTRRAIDLREGEQLDEAAFKALIRTAVVANVRAAEER